MPSQNSEIQQEITSAVNGAGSFTPQRLSMASASVTPPCTTCFQARMRGRNFSRSPGFERLAAHSSAWTRTKPDARSPS